MTVTLANLLMNLIIAGLLLATIAYCWALNKRIQILQDSKSELAQLLRHFDESTERASESIIALQTASKKIGETIQTRIEKANYLVDDLTYMIEKGNKLADQMEAGFAVSRAMNKVVHEPSHEPKLEAQMPQPEEEWTKPRSSIKEKTAASLEAVLERMVGRSNKSGFEPGLEESAKNKSRSKAEQELLDMLKTGIKG